MTNIAGKSYAMNVVTPVPGCTAWINRLILWAVTLPWFKKRLDGLITLSLIHYARWAIVSPAQWPRLAESQPKETVKYSYMFFFSNFNGSWDQYVDSFHMAIPTGLNLFWSMNVKYPKSRPLQPFHAYITYNQPQTDYYFNAYPLAASNDVKGAKVLRDALLRFMDARPSGEAPEDFKKAYDALLNEVQEHLNIMEPTPIVSLASYEAEKRRELRLSGLAKGA